MLCLEGPPGVGKAALAAALRDRLRVSTFGPGAADLEEYQAAPCRWALVAQLRILVDRCDVVRKGRCEVVVGSPRSDSGCHAPLAGMSGVELALYREWAAIATRHLPTTHHLFVRGDAEDAFLQVFHRGRREQAQLGSAHLEKLHGAFETEFGDGPATRLPRGCSDNAFLLEPAVAAVVGLHRQGA